jgi:hypothetical protein
LAKFSTLVRADLGKEGLKTDILNQPTDLSLWSALVGIVLPELVAFIQSEKWPSWLNALIFGAACLFAAAVTEWIRNGSSWGATGYFHTLLVIIFAGLAAYHLYWKPSGHIAAARRVGSGVKPG